jgi:hypothetical protein
MIDSPTCRICCIYSATSLESSLALLESSLILLRFSAALLKVLRELPEILHGLVGILFGIVGILFGLASIFLGISGFTVVTESNDFEILIIHCVHDVLSSLVPSFRVHRPRPCLLLFKTRKSASQHSLYRPEFCVVF